MRADNFRWENIEVATINKRFDFINMFLKDYKGDKLRMLDVSMFESVLSLEYIDRIAGVNICFYVFIYLFFNTQYLNISCKIN